MIQQVEELASYDGSNPGKARDDYNILMGLWEAALKYANDPDSNCKEYCEIADRHYSEAKEIRRAYNKYHHGNEEGDGVDDSELVLVPPESWFRFSSSDKIRFELLLHLKTYYPWVLPSEPTSRFNPSGR